MGHKNYPNHKCLLEDDKYVASIDTYDLYVDHAQWLVIYGFEQDHYIVRTAGSLANLSADPEMKEAIVAVYAMKGYPV
jgi:hypothetical protein